MAKKKKTKKAKTGKEMMDNEVSSLKRGKAKMDKEMSKAGVDYKTVAGVIIALIGVLLILFNLAAVLMAFIGFVLIYFGLKMLGYTLKL
jgi:hypothetical protein